MILPKTMILILMKARQHHLNCTKKTMSFLTQNEERRQYLLTEVTAIVEERRKEKLDKFFTLFSRQLGRMDDWALEELLTTLQSLPELQNTQADKG